MTVKHDLHETLARELEQYLHRPIDILHLVPDPRVPDVYAACVETEGVNERLFFLLTLEPKFKDSWEIEEVEFTSWPPQVNRFHR